MKNKLLSTVIVLALGGATYYVVKQKSNRKKRRAKRAGNGARLEVVVIAGNPSEPMTRSISLDLERRGYIVYIVCNTIEDEVMVQNESRPDIKPLMIDIVDVSSSTLLKEEEGNNQAQTRPKVPMHPSSASRLTSKHHTPRFKAQSRTT